MVYSTDRSKAVVPVLVLLFFFFFFFFFFFLLCGLFYEAICFMSYLVLFIFVFFSPFSIAITSLGEELILVLFVRLFDLRLFGFVCFLFLLVFGKGCGL